MNITGVVKLTTTNIKPAVTTDDPLAADVSPARLRVLINCACGKLFYLALATPVAQIGNK